MEFKKANDCVYIPLYKLYELSKNIIRKILSFLESQNFLDPMFSKTSVLVKNLNLGLKIHT